MGKELSLAIKISGKLDKSLSTAINSAQSQLNSLNAGANKISKAAMTGIVTGSAAIIGASITKAMSYEKSMAGVAKVVDECRDSNGNLTDTYYELSDGILDLSTKIPMTAEGFASIVESAGQAGIAKDELLSFAEDAAKMGVAFDTTAEQAGDWMAQWRTSMGLSQGEVVSLADQINYLGNTSSEKATKLADVVSRVGSLGKIAGLTGGQVAALAASMPGVEAEISATGIKNMTKAMTAGEAATKRQQEVLSKLGFSSTELAERMQTDATGAILDFLGAMKQLPEAEQSAALSQYFGSESVAAIAPLLANLDNLEAQFRKVGDSSQYADSMNKEYEAAAATTANKVELLKNTITKELIEMGQQLLPIVGEAVEELTAKMPEIADKVTAGLEKAIPVISDLFMSLIENADTIVDIAMNIGKAFMAIKIGSSAIKGIDSMITLCKNLSTVAKAAGKLKTIQGVFSSLTGIGTAGGVLNGVLSGIISAAGPIAAATAVIIGLGAAIDYISTKKFRYAEGMSEKAEEIGQATNALVKYNEIAQEVSELRLIINNPASSAEQVSQAQQRLQEIANMLGEEYNLTINADTTQLENAISMAQQLSRSDLIKSAGEFIDQAQKGVGQYKDDVTNLPQLQANQKALEEQDNKFKNISASAELYTSTFENGLSSQEEYLNNMNSLYQKSKEAGMSFLNSGLGDNLQSTKDINGFIENINKNLINTGSYLGIANKDLNDMTDRIAEFDDSIQKSGTYLSQALASDVQAGDAWGADTDISMLESLGKVMLEAGKNTDAVAVSFAAAKSGYTDFAAAVGDGKAAEMAQSFMEYKTAIGDTAESAVQGAALIQNGFESVAQATQAGGDAINNVINDMKSLGDMQGIFDGLDSGGVADKLSDMAHAMNLIPESKTITIDANGNFAVIEEAENQIASLKSIGNVDVSVNANGDFSILNEATGEIQVLQGLGAVSLTVNAQGNIDVLNEAGEVISTIDSKNAQVSVNGQVSGMSEVEQAEQTVQNINGVSAEVTVTASDNASSTITNVQNALNTLGGSTANPGINANDQASGVIQSVSAQLDSLNGKTATTVVITRYETQGTPPANNARGTSNFGGGLTYLNDQPNIPDPREVIEYGGSRWFYEGENVLANLPRGARIYNASDSKAFINGSHRNGLDRVPFDGYIAELHQGEQVLTSEAANDYSGSGFSEMLDWLREEMRGGFGNRSDRNGNGGGNGGQIVFSPTINAGSDTDRASIMSTMRMSFAEFKEFMGKYERETRRRVF